MPRSSSCAPLRYDLTPEQARRLQGYIQTYRRSAYASQLPGRERNRALRLAQHFQGQLAEALTQGTVPLSLLLSDEERGILQNITDHLLTLNAQQNASAGQPATMQDLTELQRMLQRQPGNQEQPEPHHQGPQKHTAQRSLHHA